MSGRFRPRRPASPTCPRQLAGPARLRRLASAWLAGHELRPGGVRIDVVGILRPAAGPATLRHVRGVG